MTRRFVWCCCLMAMGGLLLQRPSITTAADQTPAATVVDLEFIQAKNGPHSWEGVTLDKDGKCLYPQRQGRQKQLLLRITGGKLRADTNADGAIDDKDAPAVDLKKDHEAACIKVPAQFGGKKVDFPLFVRALDLQDQKLVIVGPGGALKATFGKHVIHIYGVDLAGTVAPGQSMVSIRPATSVDAAMDYSMMFSQTMAIGKDLYKFEIQAQAGKLKLTPYVGPVADVKIECAAGSRLQQVVLHEVNNAQVGLCDEQQTGRFVPGKYRFSSINLGSGSDKGDPTAMLFGYHDQNAAPLELKPGNNVIKVGTPLTMSFVASHKDGNVTFTAVTLTGQAGETYRPSINEAKDTFAAFIRSGAKEVKLTKLEYG